MQITWKGNASVILEAAGERLCFDPFVELIGGSNPNTIDEFLDEENIFITHGHFDHLFNIPQLLEDGDPTMFCTQVPAKTIASLTDMNDSVAVIEPGMEIGLGDVKVRVIRSEHIAFDKRLVMKTLSPKNVLSHPRNAMFVGWANKKFKDGGEVVAYEVKAEGKTLLVLGSMALKADEDYPVSPDLLLLPYQGSSDLVGCAREVISRISPKKIVLTHFDNAFPPVSSDVDTRPLKKMMAEEFPEIQVVKPSYGKSVRI